MLNKLEERIVEVWGRVYAGLSKNELDRRLARRRQPICMRPPRAWCLAIKASDRRIDEYFGWDSKKNQFRDGPQAVELSAKLVRRLTRPQTTGYFLERGEVARMLGVGPGALSGWMDRGVFAVRRVPGLGGKRGHPVPTLHSRNLLDPGAGANLAMAHEIWGTHMRYLRDRVPKDFAQVVRRTPVFQEIWRNRKRRAYVPVRDPLDLSKWTKDGEYVPDKHELYLEEVRKQRAEKRWQQMAEWTPGVEGVRQFTGFRWLCPGCGRRVKMLVMPVFAVAALKLLGEEEPGEDEVDGLARPAATFACLRCHQVRHTELWTDHGWNLLITQLSGGLLYGHEVERPEWLPRERRGRAYFPHRRAKPARKREEVLARLLAGETFAQVAREMGVGLDSVRHYAHKAYRKLGCKTLEEVRALKAGEDGGEKSGSAAWLPLPAQRGWKRKQVLALVMQGKSTGEIAETVGISRNQVWVHLTLLYRIHKVHRRDELVEKLRGSRGVEEDAETGPRGPSLISRNQK